MVFIEIDNLLKKIAILLQELDIYESRSQRIKQISFDLDQIGYPCGIRKRIIRQDSYDDYL